MQAAGNGEQSSPEHKNNQNSEGQAAHWWCSCWKIFKCRSSDETKSLLNHDDGNSTYASLDSSPTIPDAQSLIVNERSVEMIELKPLRITKVDDIFKVFQEIFNEFYTCQNKLQTAVTNFKKARKTTGEFRVCLEEFKRELDSKGHVVVIKKLTIKFPKVVLKEGSSESSDKDAAEALASIFQEYRDMEKLPVKVTTKGIICVEKVMGLDYEEIAGEEFGKGEFDFGKIPEQLKNMRDNLKEIKKAPKIVTSFFDYATSIMQDLIEVFGNEQNKKELRERRDRVHRDQEQENDELQKLNDPKPPQEIKFASLGIPSVDRIFNDIAKLVNPLIKLSQDLFDARKHLEQAMKAVSEFRDDPSKAFDDYLEELKERLKKGKVHIVVSFHGSHVEIEKIDGLEPKATQDMRSGFTDVLKSGDELTDLAPDSQKKIISLIQDVSNISKSDIKAHVTLKELPSKLSALHGNSKEAKKIPEVLKFLFFFVRNLIMDIKEALHTKKGEN